MRKPKECKFFSHYSFSLITFALALANLSFFSMMAEINSPLMEALFSTQMAVYEAWIMLLCVGVFIGIYMFDGVHWIKRVIEVLTPRPPTPPVPLLSDEPVEIVSPMLAEITPAEIEEHE